MTKYHARPTTVDNIRFASAAEADRYHQLKYLQRAGQIKNLELQPRYPLHVNGTHICTYVADFRYTTNDGATVVEDVKGFATRLYRMKARLMFAIHGITIHEVHP